MSAGTLVAVVGPSGAGKDTLIRLARPALAGQSRIVFVRRVVTRAADPRHEDHETLSPEAFAAAEAAGDFALVWRAHGLAYGLPRAVDRALTAGRVVVANLSRAVLAEAAARFGSLRVVHVDAPEHLRHARIAGRGREAAAVTPARAARRVELPRGLDVVHVMNDGPAAAGAAQLVDVLRALADGPRRP